MNTTDNVQFKLRQLLAHHVAGASGYFDDGELQDNVSLPCIDFLRDHPDAIKEKLVARNRLKAVVESKAKFVRKVVCAAIRSYDGKLVIGPRHYDKTMIEAIEARVDKDKFYHSEECDQGFVDQNGGYMTREEAFWVARSANQIGRLEDCISGSGGKWFLTSEALY